MRTRHAIGRSAALLALLLPLLLAAGCAVRLIADRDEVLVQKTVALHERFERLVLALEDAADTADSADGAYPGHAAAYSELLVLLRVMAVRAESAAKNERTIEQVDLLRDSVERLRAQHRQNSAKEPPRELSRELLAALREPFVAQLRAILVLQQALDR